MPQTSSRDKLATLRALIELARPYRKSFLVVGILALLATGADLLQPLIYRIAINDVAGLFVVAEDETSPPEARQPHGPGFVAPRTPPQTLSTLLWAAAGLFAISVVGYLLLLAANYKSTAVASHIEANVIQATFGHVLRLPLSFFVHRASGGLAKRIDQSDQVAPIISAFSQQIAPEALRVVGICAIMLTQSWRLTLAAL